MSNRVTKKMLENAVYRLNRTLGKPTEPYTRDDQGKFRAVPGVYVLDWAYGGVKLAQISNEGGGQQNISSGGFGTKRELIEAIWAIESVLRAENIDHWDYAQGEG